MKSIVNGSAWLVLAVSLAAAVAGCGVLGTIVVPGGSRDCGGLQGRDCLPWEYCNFDDGSCGAADQMGVCERRPDVCTEIYAPVSGCDDRTYGNECEAAGNGVSVAHEGPCVDGSAEICGGLQGLDCPAGEYCRFEEHCGAGDQTGLCATIPDGCDDVFEPVCGCDGETYGNSCEAAANGVSVASQGECQQAEPCLSQCEVPGLPCEEQPLGSFENFDEAASSWVEDLKDHPPMDFDDDGVPDVPFVYAGTCENGLTFLFARHSLGGRLSFFDGETGEFRGMVNQTDILAGECWGFTFWPERIDCQEAVVTEVFIGENYNPGDPILLWEAP